MDPFWLLVGLVWLTAFAGVLLILRTVLASRLRLLQRLQRYGTRELETPEAVAEREMAARAAQQRRQRLVQGFALSRRMLSWLKAMDQRLQTAGIPMKGKEFAMICATGGLLAASLGYLLGGLILSAAATLAGLALPFVWLARLEAARKRRLKEQIPELLAMMGNALQAGHGFMQAAQIASRELGAPVGDEFQKMLQEVNLGATTETALRNLGERMNDEDMDMVITAVLIQRQVGGNLAEVLANIHETIRERIRLQGHISALTAQGRLSGVIISALPVAIAAFIFMNSPEFLAPLLSETAGQLMLAAALVMELMGIFIIRRIVQIEV